MDGELARRDIVEVLPPHRERHRHAWPRARAVCGHDRGPAHARRVDEDPPAPILLHERRCGDVGIQVGRALSDRASRSRDVGHRGSMERHVDVQPLRSARLHCALEALLGQRRAHEVSGARRHGKGIGAGWIEIDDKMRRALGAIRPHEGRVILHRPLVGEPDEGSPVVAQRIVDIAPRGLRPEASPPHPVRGVARQVLLHEGFLATMHPDHRERPVHQLGQDPVVDGVEILDQVSLRRSGVLEERLVEIGQLDAMKLLSFRHGAEPSPSSTPSRDTGQARDANSRRSRRSAAPPAFTPRSSRPSSAAPRTGRAVRRATRARGTRARMRSSIRW